MPWQKESSHFNRGTKIVSALVTPLTSNHGIRLEQIERTLSGQNSKAKSVVKSLEAGVIRSSSSQIPQQLMPGLGFGFPSSVAPPGSHRHEKMCVQGHFRTSSKGEFSWKDLTWEFAVKNRGF
jgi:hypothetical protein